MIKESFVSFETAVLLKEKGFDEPCQHFYKFDSDEIYRGTVFTNSQIGDKFYNVPTLQMARQWLDEAYDVRIFILPARDTDNYICHVYVVWKINKSSGDFEEVYMSGFYEDYDVCMEGAIDYCVESLI